MGQQRILGSVLCARCLKGVPFSPTEGPNGTTKPRSCRSPAGHKGHRVARLVGPEDCGGIYGYKDFLKAIRDLKHREHEQMFEWAGGPFDPKEFDVDTVNGLLGDIG